MLYEFMSALTSVLSKSIQVYSKVYRQIISIGFSSNSLGVFAYHCYSKLKIFENINIRFLTNSLKEMLLLMNWDPSSIRPFTIRNLDKYILILTIISKLLYDICYPIFNHGKTHSLIYDWLIMHTYNDKNAKTYQAFGLYKCINVRYDLIWMK